MRQALILAAGVGSRLRPLTDSIPKALVPFRGRPLLEWLILRLKKEGFQRLVINLHHYPEQIKRFVEQRNSFDLDIRFSYEENLLDTGGAIKKAAPEFDPDFPLLVHNADIVSTIPLAGLFDLHRKKRAAATLAVNQRKTTRYLLFNTDMRLCGWENTKSGEHLWVEAFKNMPCRPYAFCGIHILSPALIGQFTDAECFSVIPEYLRLAESEKILAHDLSRYSWADMGSMEKIKEAEALFSTEKLLLMTKLS